MIGRKFTVVAAGRDAVTNPLQKEDQRRNQLGLTEEEEAFYKILAKHPNALQDFDLIKELLKWILAEVKKSASQPDWYKKDDTKAQLQLAVKKVLRFKVKAELQEILDEVMEQAEARYKECKMSVAYTKGNKPIYISITGKELEEAVDRVIWEADERLMLVSPYIKLDEHLRICLQVIVNMR